MTGLTLADPLTPQLLAQELTRQAVMVAFVDAFWFVTLSFLAVVPLLLLLRRRALPNARPPQEPRAVAFISVFSLPLCGGGEGGRS